MEGIESILENLVAKQDICYMSSVDSHGFPNTRAMLKPRVRHGVKEFFLATNTSSHKVAIYRNNPKACLYFCDPKFYRGVMFKGNVEVIEDSAMKRLLWEESDTIFYEGVNDPDYCVLKFTSISATYYRDYQTTEVKI